MCTQEAICVLHFSNNFSETHCIKVGLYVRISVVRVLFTRRGEEAPPPKKKFFLKKKLKLFQILIFFDDDIKVIGIRPIAPVLNTGPL